MDQTIMDAWPMLVVIIAGVVVCTGAGLLSLIPDPERPLRFLPVYGGALVLFLAGLAMILWSQTLATMLRDRFSPG